MVRPNFDIGLFPIVILKCSYDKRSKETMQGITRDCREFVYNFADESGCDEFKFHTFSRENDLRRDLVEITSTYSSQNVVGSTYMNTSIEEAKQIRELYCKQVSLHLGSSMVWKIYHTRVDGSEADASFIGFVKLSLPEEDGKVSLKPYIHLREKYQKQRLGPKALFCLLAELLKSKTWFERNVKGLLLEFHPDNKACMKLKKRWFGKTAFHKKCSKRPDGTWIVQMDELNRKCSQPVNVNRFFVCGALTLGMFFKSNIRQSNCKLVSLTDYPGKKKKERPPLSTRKVKKIEADLQEFSYTSNHGSHYEKFTFRTYSRNINSSGDLQNLVNLYGDDKLMKTFSGLPAIFKDYRQAEKMRANYMLRNSLNGALRSLQWQLFYSNGSEERFIGLTGINLTEKQCETGSRQLLSPMILLLPDFHSKRLGPKAIYCLMHKLLSLETFIMSMCDGIIMSIAPHNKISQNFKDSILMNNDREVINLKRRDGCWIYGPWRFDGKVRPRLMKEFIVENMGVIKKLFMAKIQQKVQKRGLPLLSDSGFDIASEELNALRCTPVGGKIGVLPLYMLSADFQLLTQLLLQGKVNHGIQVDKPVLGEFKLHLPKLACRGLSEPRPTFFLLFFTDEDQGVVRDFETISLDNTKTVLRRQYIAYTYPSIKTGYLKIRLCEDVHRNAELVDELETNDMAKNIVPGFDEFVESLPILPVRESPEDIVTTGDRYIYDEIMEDLDLNHGPSEGTLKENTKFAEIVCYLLELRTTVFENRTLRDSLDLSRDLCAIWTSGVFKYNRKKRKRKRDEGEFTVALQLHSTTMHEFTE